VHGPKTGRSEIRLSPSGCHSQSPSTAKRSWRRSCKVTLSILLYLSSRPILASAWSGSRPRAPATDTSRQPLSATQARPLSRSLDSWSSSWTQSTPAKALRASRLTLSKSPTTTSGTAPRSRAVSAPPSTHTRASQHDRSRFQNFLPGGRPFARSRTRPRDSLAAPSLSVIAKAPPASHTSRRSAGRTSQTRHARPPGSPWHPANARSCTTPRSRTCHRCPLSGLPRASSHRG